MSDTPEESSSLPRPILPPPVSKRAARRATTNPRKKGGQLAGGRAQMFSSDELKEALEKAYGNVTLVAAHLKISRPAIYDYLDRYPELREIRDRTKHECADMAAAQLFVAMQKGERWAILKVLDKYGRYLGPEWADNPGAPGGQVPVTNIIKVKFVDADRSKFGRLGTLLDDE
jgi:Bacterial regulatory protein, Fis family